MATKKSETTNPQVEINKLKTELRQVRLDIKAGVEKNTNAHKSLKKQLAQALTRAHQQ